MHITDQMISRVNTTLKHREFFLISTRTTLLAFAEKVWVLESTVMSLLHSNWHCTHPPEGTWGSSGFFTQIRALQSEENCTLPLFVPRVSADTPPCAGRSRYRCQSAQLGPCAPSGGCRTPHPAETDSSYPIHCHFINSLHPRNL